MLRRIARELRHHALFTALGAVSGITIMVILVLTGVTSQVSAASFDVLHPLHVVLSALTTTAMYRKYGASKIWTVVLVGYCGSVGIATLSDAFIPYLGGALLGAKMELHVPFIETEETAFWGIETWQLVNSAAFVGIIIGYFRHNTKIPHLGHVFTSTWASLFYFIAFGVAHWLPLLPLVFLFLFLAVWIPCCTSDIVFPLIFAKKEVVHQEQINYNLQSGGK